MEETFTDLYEKLIQQTSGVGSDVKSLRNDFNQHMAEDRAFKEEMKPVLHGKRLFVYFADFMKYLGIPMIAVFGFIMWWLKRDI